MADELLYSIYKKIGQRWVRQSEDAYPIEKARQVFATPMRDIKLGGRGCALKAIADDDIYMIPPRPKKRADQVNVEGLNNLIDQLK